MLSATRLGGILLCAALVGACQTRYYIVPNASMKPGLPEGERLRIDTSAFDDSEPERWEIVAFRSRLNPERLWTFRVVGLPGETISYAATGLQVDGAPPEFPADMQPVHYQMVETDRDTVPHPLTVPAGEYYLLGDNPERANDSRFWGTVAREDIVGRVPVGD